MPCRQRQRCSGCAEQMETKKFWGFGTAEAPVLLQKLSCVSVNVDHTERKRNDDFQGFSPASRILCFPRTCNMAYDRAFSLCLLLLKAQVQILPQASQNLLSSPHKSTCMSQHPVIYSSYSVISFCPLTCCCLRIVPLSFVNQLYFAYHLCFCEPLWKAINACRFFMRNYCDIGRVFFSFILVEFCSREGTLWWKEYQIMVQTTFP